ncbi:hypothetical protein Tco_0238751, partial [Tanacetum coccineum]
SGFNLSPKKLREDHSTSGDAGASTAGKSLVSLQGLLDCSTLAAKVGVTAAAIVPFVTSSVTLTQEYSSHHSSTNVADAEVTSIVRSPIPPPPVMTAAVASTSSAHVLRAGTEPAIQSLFADFASPSAARPDTAGPSDPRGTEISADTFYISQEMDSETLQQIYVPK